MKLIHFDPALKDNDGNLSDNLGDAIISLYVQKILAELFPDAEQIRIATHSYPSKDLKKIIHSADLCFLGGSNILNSLINIYNNWKFDKNIFDTIFSKRLDVITLGTGWGGYQKDPGLHSKIFYSRRLDHSKIHSVRDSYSAAKLNSLKGLKVLNTGCPTTWKLNGVTTNRTNNHNSSCVFTLTDYAKDPVSDNKLLDCLLPLFNEIVFFPQGKQDEQYLQSLPVYQRNKSRFKILERSIKAFKSFISENKTVFIGTRLHAGIHALNSGTDALIISLDNRAKEMAKDCFLPVIERNEHELISKWVAGETVFKEGWIRIPLQNIDTWKKQFRG